VPYLNSVPFYRGLQLKEPAQVRDYLPRELGEKAAAGEVTAGPISLVDFFRLQDRFERLGRFGIAVRGRAGSALLFSRRPIRQLDGATIAVTEASSTTTCLLRLLLAQRYKIVPSYHQGRNDDAEALLLIGDETLQFQRRNTQYPFEIDVAFEWWLWQHLPFVFAVWAVRSELEAVRKKAIGLALTKALAENGSHLESIAQEHAKTLGIPEQELHRYLSNFIYRLSQPEEEGITRFKELLDGSGLL
jgi:chorismate dehydratase